MANGSGSQKKIRKAIGALKDTTKVGLVKVNSEYKGLDVAIVKATSHDVVLPKEKHIRTIFGALSTTSPRADVTRCIHRLIKRLSKTHNWTVALKTLLIIHRSIRETDHSFPEELISYSQGSNLMLNLSHFRDVSTPEAWDYSAWIRTYALYLEERLECYRVMKYDINRDQLGTKLLDTPALLEQLPAMQQLLFRLLACKPEGAASRNSLIIYCLSIVARESSSLYIGISNGILNLVDKFFEMRHWNATKALEIYKRSSSQAEKLSEFFEICRGYDFASDVRLTKIEQAPASFVTAMEDYVKQTSPNSSPQNKTRNNDQGSISPKSTISTPEPVSPAGDEHHEQDIATTLFDSESDHADDPTPRESKSEKLAVKIVRFESSFFDSPRGESENNSSNKMKNNEETLLAQATSWELALVTAFTSDEPNPNPTLAGGLDKLTLEALYEASSPTDEKPNQTDDSTAAVYNPFQDCLNQVCNNGVVQVIKPVGGGGQNQAFNMFPPLMMMMPHELEEEEQLKSTGIGNPFLDSLHVDPSSASSSSFSSSSSSSSASYHVAPAQSSFSAMI